MCSVPVADGVEFGSLASAGSRQATREPVFLFGQLTDRLFKEQCMI